MKLKAKLLYVRDHDLQQGSEGIQKIFHFQTDGLGDVRFTLLVHTHEHEEGPAATITKPKSEVTDHELGALLSAGRARIDTPYAHKGDGSQVVVIQGDEGKEFEIEIRPL